MRGLDAVGQGEKIFDAGPQSVQRLRSAMAASATVVWNGPLGVFEVPPFTTLPFRKKNFGCWARAASRPPSSRRWKIARSSGVGTSSEASIGVGVAAHGAIVEVIAHCLADLRRAKPISDLPQ